MNRRKVLFGAAALALSGPPALADTGARLDQLASAIDPWLDLRNAHTGETLNGQFFEGTGYARTILKDADWHLRDWRQKSAEQMDIRLFWALAAVRQAVMAEGHDGQIVVLSGYRTRKTNDMLRQAGHGAARNSFHLRAQAVDFVIPGVPVDLIARYMRWLQVGGIGHYPRNFIHIDTGPERTWIG